MGQNILERQTDIERLQVGKELDEYIELYVFDKTKSMYFQARDYSTNLNDAWDVFTNHKFMTRELVLSSMREGYEHLQYKVEFTTVENVFRRNKMYGRTAAEAICRSALLALTCKD